MKTYTVQSVGGMLGCHVIIILSGHSTSQSTYQTERVNAFNGGSVLNKYILSQPSIWKVQKHWQVFYISVFWPGLNWTHWNNVRKFFLARSRSKSASSPVSRPFLSPALTIWGAMLDLALSLNYKSLAVGRMSLLKGKLCQAAKVNC